ncbi:hypothetical protein H4R99_001938 [Coemansia sp. RSA 1722]|nr:hypothetical protein IWW45_000911 [Coemansia sp. RSA 485]KAJ2604233.1 hypothetical protein H4R99_001938 [Coemansia sp. RSA 1722]
MFFKLIHALALAVIVSAHLDMISPCPRYSPRGVNCPALPSGQSLDYSMSSPLGTNEPLCKHTVPFPTPSATWTAGQSVTVQLAPGGATHGGGHCQFSISYDGGNTFVVLYEVLGQCFGADQGQRDFTFTLPSNLPSSDKAVFAWTWVNAVGNREFYMNCADVAIKGSSGSGSFTGKQMTIANHQGYPTIPEFSGNYDTGIQYYNDAKSITVSGSGSSGSTSNNSNNGSSSETPYENNSPLPHVPLPSTQKDTLPTSSAPSTYIATSVYSSTIVSTTPTDAPVSHVPSVTDIPVYSTSIVSTLTSTDTAKPVYPTDEQSDLPSDSAFEQVYSTNQVPPTPVVSSNPVYSTMEVVPQTTVGNHCSEGTMRCSEDDSGGFQYCLYGSWTSAYQCPSGTKCKQQSDSILCDWP